MPAGYRLISFDDIDSTNSEALRRIRAGAMAGNVIWARRQSAGRGRRGNRWRSPEGNLYASLIVEVPENRLAGQLAFVAALGVGEAVRSALPDGASLTYKWPNDLMLNDRKLGGILIEGGSDLFAVGVGLNVAHAPTDLDAAALATDVAVPELLGRLCQEFDRWYRLWQREGFVPVRDGWLRHAHRLHAPIEARFPDGTSAAGLFTDIDRDGALVLRRDDGSTRTIATGEVFFPAA